MRGTGIITFIMALLSGLLVFLSGGHDPVPGLGPGVDIIESVEQLSVTGLEPGAEVELVDRVNHRGRGGKVVTEGVADEMGSIVFRDLEPGDRYGVRVDDGLARGLRVYTEDGSQPSQDLYEDQTLEEGFQYIETRDGTTLSVNVVLPGPIEDGPYPTVVEYSGYDPSNPLAGIGGLLGPGVDPTPLCGELPTLCKAPAQPASLLASVMGYAVVGVNVRGTGCSGGAYDYFETMQVLDGYDAIETVAAQDWVANGKVGMVGLSYPGISQLFVAQSQPPSLAAITPLSVYGDSGTGVLRPGGLLNTGFAVSWVEQVLSNSAPSGTGWVRELIADGDTTCEDNQRLRLQNVDVIAKAFDNPYYTDEIAGPLDIRTFAGDIDVPVFLASAWQDEQTGPSFADILDDFDAAPVTRFTVYNGLHADGFAPQVLAEWKAFLDLYVADQVPTVDPIIRLITPVFTEGIFGGGVEFPPDRWAGIETPEEARAVFEAEPPVRVIFDSGTGSSDGLPVGGFEHTAAAWPDPDVSPQRLFLSADGGLAPEAPTAADAVRIQPDPEVVDDTYWGGGSSGLWQALPSYDWEPAAVGERADFQSEPLTEDTVMLGTASVDLWVKSSTTDAALEVVVSEIRPDGNETLVQSGRLLASYRALDDSSTELKPVQYGRESDVAPLEPDTWTPVRIQVPAFGHAFRAGSSVRITVNTPGGDQARWAYAELEVDGSAEHLIGTGADAASSVALPVLAGVDIPTPLPACPALRGQPCRPTPPIDNDEILAPTPPTPPAPPTPPSQKCRGINEATGKSADQRPASDNLLRRCLRINQVQSIGTHNSYKQAVTPEVFDLLQLFDTTLAQSLEYWHVPLAEQFSSQAVRQIELDVFADGEGGHLAGRAGLDVAGVPNDPPAEMLEPGFKVLHVQDLDFNSSCLTFVDCLRQIDAWSDANPGHLPIAVLVELKDDAIPDPLDLGFVVPEPIGATELDELDAEIRSVFDESEMITPDDVRGAYPTLESAVLAGQWPTLRDAEGQVMFLMDNAGTKRDDYRAGRPSLEGRVLFTNSTPGEADAAFVKVNGPLGNVERIQDLVASGYVVRTRSDEPTVQARSGDTTQRDAAIASGAQWVSTDYPVPGSSPFSAYYASIPDGDPARCNPINTGPRCRSSALERD